MRVIRWPGILLVYDAFRTGVNAQKQLVPQDANIVNMVCIRVSSDAYETWILLLVYATFRHFGRLYIRTTYHQIYSDNAICNQQRWAVERSPDWMCTMLQGPYDRNSILFGSVGDILLRRITSFSKCHLLCLSFLHHSVTQFFWKVVAPDWVDFPRTFSQNF